LKEGKRRRRSPGGSEASRERRQDRKKTLAILRFKAITMMRCVLGATRGCWRVKCEGARYAESLKLIFKPNQYQLSI
jgi:hypothetical protein